MEPRQTLYGNGGEGIGGQQRAGAVGSTSDRWTFTRMGKAEYRTAGLGRDGLHGQVTGCERGRQEGD